MVKDILLDKESHVVQMLSTDEVQAKISKPCNTGISFTFPISSLLKSKKRQESLEEDSQGSFYTYSSRDSGFQDWYA